MTTTQKHDDDIEATLQRAAGYLARRGSEYLEHPVPVQESDVAAPRRNRRVLIGTAAAATLCVTALAGSFIGERSSGKVATANAINDLSQPLEAPVTYSSLPNQSRFMGLVPDCRKTNDEVFDCTINRFPDSARVADMSGYVNFFVDASSHVAGGCRVGNPEGTRLMCYVGIAAVEQKIIAPSFLGQWVPGGKAAG